ncbi:DUF2796 domain-containing protein [Thiorhodococcus mannitoliphagus]|uniref:DUF2796 domain-containing protein n=1 Tax=Thiorhodococcus mannitoliphagus TaxID=329406 RepID=A0A6P1DSY2_9GAMM|nr:DUF2796 domain-containing protein [Thiorhodococcus mannitoliphagus]NEX21417.1 DUF2796 domain-containing protein [Thiorhodococcus mannitoliphagus]
MLSKPLWRIGVAAMLIASEGLCAHAEGKGRPYVHGIANLKFTIEGSHVIVGLFAPAATMLGFESAPRTQVESETLKLARENLAAGDGMIRFNTKAGCRLVKAKVDTDLPDAVRSGKSTTRDGPARVEISAEYRFECARPEALDSAALGLFMGFPALERALVRYLMPDGQGAAELTPGNPVVSFVPL